MQSRPSESITIYAQSQYGTTGLYPRFLIVNSAGSTVSTVDATDVGSGSYSGSGTAPDSPGKYLIRKLFYTDSGRTTLSGVEPIIGESLEVDYGYGAAPFGGMSVSEGSVDLSPLTAQLDGIDEKIKLLLEKIDKKSEFDPRKDLVQVNVDIPQIKDINKIVVSNKSDLSPIIESLGKVKQAIVAMPKSINIPEPIDYSSRFVSLDKLMKAIDASLNKISNYQQQSVNIDPIIESLSSIKSAIVDVVNKSVSDTAVEVHENNGLSESLITVLTELQKFSSMLGKIKSDNAVFSRALAGEIRGQGRAISEMIKQFLKNENA